MLAGVTVLAACGGGGSGDAQVASLGGASGATSTTAAQTEADTQQAMLDFAKCMREQGIDMPDPEFDENGNGGIRVGVVGKPGEMDEAKMEAAQKACQAYMDKVRANAPPPDPAKEEEQKQKMLAFAQCMRDHGIDMPDPEISTDDKGGVLVKQGGPGVDPESPGFQDAQEACQKEVGLDDMMATRSAGGGPATGSNDSGGANP